MAEKHPCEGCYYFGGRWEAVKCCNYCLITNQRRPCPPGKECIVRRDSERNKRKAMTIKTENLKENLKNI